MDEGVLAIIWLLLSSLGLLLLLFGIRYLKGRENMAMIANGMDPKLNVRRPAPFVSLKWGLLLLGAGAGLLLAFILGEYVLVVRSQDHYRHDDDAIVAVYFALIAMGGGVGLITSYKIEKKELFDKEEAERKQELELKRIERMRKVEGENL